MTLSGARKTPCAYCRGTGEVEIPAEVETVEAYYFGCWKDTGHYWHDRSGRSILHRFDERFPESLRKGHIDGNFCPGAPVELYGRHSRPEVEGEASLHYIEGWTVLAWWDRSVDHRSASNSALVVKGTYDFTAILEIAKAQYPHVMKRQRQPLVLVEPPKDAPR